MNDLLTYFAVRWGSGRWIPVLCVFLIGIIVGAAIEQMLKGCP